MKTIIALLAALALSGCMSLDSPINPDTNYEFGDITGGVISMQAEYCSEADPRERAFRLAALRAAGVPIPPSGACADIIALVPEVEIDTTETEADRERFNAVPD